MPKKKGWNPQVGEKVSADIDHNTVVGQITRINRRQRIADVLFQGAGWSFQKTLRIWDLIPIS